MTDHARRNQQARTAPEDEPPSRRDLDHRWRPCEFGKVSGISTGIGEYSQSASLRAQPRDAPAKRAAISKLGEGPELRSCFAAVDADDLAGDE